MSVPVQCDQCGAQFNLKDEGKLGKRMKCPSCQSVFTVAPSRKPGSSGRKSSKKKMKGSQGIPVLPLAIGGGALLVILLGVAVVMRIPSKSPAPTAPVAEADAAAEEIPAESEATGELPPLTPQIDTPAVAQVVTPSVTQAERRNSLRQIALAFHNYHEVHRHFPAPDANGKQGGQRAGVGLSWRVHLLPFVNAKPLYNRFRLNEPWDSEHNKRLIKEMPDVFGTDPGGRTSFHVFVGEGTPFNLEKPGIQFHDITDGTSNTLLAVEAGPDQADVWTKPGGIPFDKQDAFAALGNVGAEVLVVLFDGLGLTIPKSIGAEMFSRMIQHADGQPVNFR